MKKIVFLFMLLSAYVMLHAQDSTRVLIVALDGISTKGLIKANTPNIDKLMLEGSYCFNNRNIIPSSTLPNWTSMLCGSGPERTGVIDNYWTTTNVKLQAVERNKNGYYPSIYQVLKESVPNVKTAFYYNWKELINTFDKEYMDDEVYLSNDAYIPNFDRAFNFMRDNRSKPTFVFLYNVDTDHAGHNYKWMSDNYIKAIERSDVQIGILFNKMKAAGLYDNTYIFFATDHGGVEWGHGGYSQDEMSIPWSVKGKNIKKGELKEQNFTVNTASMIAKFFNVKQPQVWSGNSFENVFEKPNPLIIPFSESEPIVYYTIKNKSSELLLAVNEEGKLVQFAKANDACYWYLKTSENGYSFVNKAFANKALGEKDGCPALVDKANSTTWYLSANPTEVGVYSISQSNDASSKVLKSSKEGSVAYWTPSAFNQDGLFWVLISNDPRTDLQSNETALAEKLKFANQLLKDVSLKTDPSIVGSYTQNAINTFAMVVAENTTILNDQNHTIQQLISSVKSLDGAIASLRTSEKVQIVDGKKYYIKSADTRFGDKVYLYISSANTARWGVMQADKADYFNWIITKNGNNYKLYNVGAKKYLGSCAWNASRPENIYATAESMDYELNNTNVLDEPRDWTLRSVDSYLVANPSKSFIACTDDSNGNYSDGRIRPWDPKDPGAFHDGYWRIIENKIVSIPNNVVTSTNNVVTSTNRVYATSNKIELVNKVIRVKGVDDFKIFTSTGISIPNNSVLNNGVYVVTFNGNSYKVLVD